MFLFLWKQIQNDQCWQWQEKAKASTCTEQSWSTIFFSFLLIFWRMDIFFKAFWFGEASTSVCPTKRSKLFTLSKRKNWTVTDTLYYTWYSALTFVYQALGSMFSRGLDCNAMKFIFSPPLYFGWEWQTTFREQSSEVFHSAKVQVLQWVTLDFLKSGIWHQNTAVADMKQKLQTISLHASSAIAKPKESARQNVKWDLTINLWTTLSTTRNQPTEDDTLLQLIENRSWRGR